MLPLIRAGAILPLIRWMRVNGRPVEDRLNAVDLLYSLKGDANLPIPLGPAIAFLCDASRAEGPDFACRVVTSSSVRELGVIGELALGASNVREALVRVAASLPFHTTHEIITVGSTKGGLFVREAWGLRMDAETRHFVQQYAAALIQALCTNAGTLPPIFDRMALMPHPVHGLDHLRACFGDNVVASPNNLLELFVPDDVADRPLPFGVMAPPAWDHSRDLIPLRGDGTLSASVRIIMAAMLLSDKPTVERVAHAAGTSIRTFQRRLLAEKTTFSDLLETVRRDLALAGLATGNTSAGAIAGALGYGQQSSLTRAVRRWTGTPPRSIARGPKS